MKWRLLALAIGISLPSFCQPDTTSLDTSAVNLLLRHSQVSKWIDPTQSLAYADQALLLSSKLKYETGAAMARNLKGFAFWAFGDNDLAIQAAMESLQNTKTSPAIQAESYYVLARGYMDVREQAKAMEAIRKADALAKQGNDWEMQCSILNLMGVIQFAGDRQDSALHYYNRAYELGKAHAVNPINFPRIISNIGECYATENPKLAFTYFRQAMDLATATGNQIAKASIGGIMGQSYLRMNDMKNAEAYLMDALNLARSLGLRRVVRQTYAGLVDIRLQQGRGDEAVVYLRKYYEVRDSLLNTAKVRQIVELEAKHELELREQSIRILENEKRLQSLWNNVLLGAVVLLVIVSVAGYRWMQYRYRKNSELLSLEIDYLTQQQKNRTLEVSQSDSPEENTESLDQRMLRTAITTVEKHLDDPSFSVEKLADEMHMSRTSLHRKIKTISGFAPSELIRNIRLHKASRLILGKADTVTQIALRVGFDDYAHFSKSFKKQFGVAPTQYKGTNS